jgi:type IV pilus assembly protein PilA
MLLQKLRERVAARLRNEESGFTLIELLVVMLIIGILAAIALPSFFNQRDKAGDAEAKSGVKTMQTAIETYATDNDGSYVGADGATDPLEDIEPTLSNYDYSFNAVPTQNSYSIRVTSDTGNTFDIVNTAGVLTFPCATAGEGGCPAGGTGWN